MPRCRCHSGKTERRCCGPLLAGREARAPAALMRSRYAAYAKGDVEHVMRTTHPDSPHHQADRSAWAAEIAAFTRSVRFAGLTLLDTPEPDGDEAFVSFRATLLRDGQDVGFAERSRFVRVDGAWRYVDGAAIEP